MEKRDPTQIKIKAWPDDFSKADQEELLGYARRALTEAREAQEQGHAIQMPDDLYRFIARVESERADMLELVIYAAALVREEPPLDPSTLTT